MATDMSPEQRIDAALDSVLRAAGSRLAHYTSAKAAHADLRKLRAEVQMLRATVVDSARDVIDWCDKNPPAGDALYCIARWRPRVLTPELSRAVKRRRIERIVSLHCKDTRNDPA